MWDYAAIPETYDKLKALTPEQRASLTWEQARKNHLRHDTIAMAIYSGAEKANKDTPFVAVCIANGFHDLLK